MSRHCETAALSGRERVLLAVGLIIASTVIQVDEILPHEARRRRSMSDVSFGLSSDEPRRQA
jgi:hypothetical protein